MKFFKIVLSVSILFLLSCSHSPKVNSNTENREIASNETPWTTWSKGLGSVSQTAGLLVLRNIREDLLENSLHDPHVSYKGYGSKRCTEHNKKYRSADGTCYDLKNPYVGAAGVAFGRNVPHEFVTKGKARRIMTPDPHLVSEVLHSRDEFKEVPFLNMLAASWIQFMNHDWLSHGKNDEKSRPYLVGGKKIERTRRNNIKDRNYNSKFGKTSLNTVTHWWDGSQLYGSGQATQDRVRSKSRGKLKLADNGLLPKEESLNKGKNKQNFGYEVTGFRENWWVGLSMLHLLFTKEHNAIADMLFDKYVLRKKDKKTGKWIWNEGGRLERMKLSSKRKGDLYFTDKELDEHIFQVARLINAAVMAKIHTVEWTPAILKNKTLRTAMYANWYGLFNPRTIFKNVELLSRTDFSSGANSNHIVSGIVGNGTENSGVPFSITEEFTSVYRLHPLLPEAIHLKKLRGRKEITTVPMAATRNEKAYALMEDNDLKDLFYSFGTQKPGQLVLNNFPAFMQNLDIPGFGKMDLAAVDILRDRERGVPRYNEFRRSIGLKPIKAYRDFFPRGELNPDQAALLAKLKAVYGKNGIEDIDLMVGAFAEGVRPAEFGFGETQFQIFILMASRRLMADRFFTTDYNKEHYTQKGLDWVDREGSLYHVISRHMPRLKPKMRRFKTAFFPWRN